MPFVNSSVLQYHFDIIAAYTSVLFQTVALLWYFFLYPTNGSSSMIRSSGHIKGSDV